MRVEALVVIGGAAAALLGIGGCAKEGVVATEPQQVERVAPSEVRGPFVQAGTDLAMTMLVPVTTESSEIGQELAARVETDLRALDGTVVVPRGSLIRGRVARVDSGVSPVLALDLQTVETSWGETGISAKLKGAQKVALRGTDEVYDPFYAADYDAFFYAPGAVAYPPGSVAPAGYVGYYDYYDEDAVEIRLPAGARIHAELTRPIVPAVSRAE